VVRHHLILGLLPLERQIESWLQRSLTLILCLDAALAATTAILEEPVILADGRSAFWNGRGRSELELSRFRKAPLGL
jgi:hypothetical protein